MTEGEMKKLHPVDITGMKALPDGAVEVTMEVQRMSFGGEPPSDRVSALNISYTTTREGGDEDRMHCTATLHPPPGSLRDCRTAVAELLPEEGRMNLHWKLPPPDHDLSVTLVLWCVPEGLARRFARVYGSTYDCPCGQFLWDVRQERCAAEEPTPAVASRTENAGPPEAQ